MEVSQNPQSVYDQIMQFVVELLELHHFMLALSARYAEVFSALYI